jgi:hypothetical protein
MALWDSPDLLRRCRQLARRPATDQAVPATMWYDFLTEAEAEVFAELAAVSPEQFVSPPILMSTADGGRTYTFGNDAAGSPVRPMGHAEIYPSIDAVADDALVEGEDYLVEGALIRIPNNQARRFSAGPYARLTLRPDTALSDTSHPILQPKEARMLMVYKALEKWASRPGSGASPRTYIAMYVALYPKILLQLATAYNRGGSDWTWLTGAEVNGLGLLPGTR